MRPALHIKFWPTTTTTTSPAALRTTSPALSVLVASPRNSRDSRRHRPASTSSHSAAARTTARPASLRPTPSPLPHASATLLHAPPALHTDSSRPPHDHGVYSATTCSNVTNTPLRTPQRILHRVRA
ncbi:hypothetical protein K466DRAFT_592249 [Polyporus arcularius HHB13444]|uniref:Uncharacterized protein n=1 Tax=Polyporus arcularius HHB13444 TaxID=1314778 RepID=A0A5C3NUP6_9APHY|nr:hypothetical protein K466DRAFT_592249 [Polyporus arcularius HHB13444]